MPFTWNPWFYDSVSAERSAVCVEHQGKHRWVQTHTKVDDGFCDGLFEERLDAILSMRQMEQVP